MLAVHEEIATVAESHLPLPYFYTLRNEGVYSEYYHTFTARGIREFCLELPGGIEDYLSEIRVLVLRLYARAAKGQARCFLDKATMGYDVDELVTSLDAIPFSLQFFGSDMLRMPYGYAARIFELQILRDKLRALFARQKVYIHY
jgi:hypothetical protein